MGAGASRALTDKQRAVMDRIDRRMPIKVIAGELGVSETRINQHIRALKDIFGANSLNELVEKFRESGGARSSEGTLRKPAYTNKQLSEPDLASDQSPRVDPGEIVLADAQPLFLDAPWPGSREPVVVPRILDGKNAVLLRLVTIVGIAFGTVAAVILVITAALTVSEMLDGRASMSAEQTGSTG